ncbi:MAG: phosphatidate cytidylyltransferase [Clostridia bacterium]|nr:phosphatidate cytidylyltransferase [Clostridia bacterium]
MKNRVISGLIYLGILIGVFALKIFVNDLCFDAFVWFLAIVGTFEITRAFGDSMTKVQRVLTFIFAIIVIPTCALVEYFFGYGLHVTCVCFFALAISLLSLLVFDHDATTLENIGASLFAAVYPALLLCLLVLTNHIGQDPVLEGFDKVIGTQSDVFNSNLAIMLIFVASPLSDVFAFFFGITLKKVFPKKLAPTLSPNKTIVGFVGGLIGGMIAAGLTYFVYNLALDTGYAFNWAWLPVYLAIGLLTALATSFGDLVESCIKRKKGLKDMGKIMPGHGGVLDRIDGTIFATVAVYICFAVIHLFL